MSGDLDHTIVHVRDRRTAAAHVVEMLDLDPAVDYGPFAMVRLGNHAVLAVADTLGRPRLRGRVPATVTHRQRAGPRAPCKASAPSRINSWQKVTRPGSWGFGSAGYVRVSHVREAAYRPRG